MTAEPPPQGMLCTEQDLWADVLVRAVWHLCGRVHARAVEPTVHARHAVWQAVCVRRSVHGAHAIRMRCLPYLSVCPRQARHNVDGHLATEFTTSDAGGWGWERPEPVSVACGDGNVNIGNRCVADVGLCEGPSCTSVSAKGAGAVNKRPG